MKKEREKTRTENNAPSESFVTCKITQEKIRQADAVPAAIVRPNIVQLIKKDYPHWTSDGYISREALKTYRKKYIEHTLIQQKGEISKIDEEVVKSMVEHETLVKNIEAQIDKKSDFGERLSDKIATFGGSWRFIIFFGVVLFVWISINSYVLLSRPFDPYPFILLNLILSCIAALQAPIIMMSQNRKEAKDRLRSENDYKIDLKAELEIRHLHEKMDNLMQKQWQRLLEIQQLQLDMMDEKERRR